MGGWQNTALADRFAPYRHRPVSPRLVLATLPLLPKARGAAGVVGGKRQLLREWRPGDDWLLWPPGSGAPQKLRRATDCQRRCRPWCRSRLCSLAVPWPPEWDGTHEGENWVFGYNSGHGRSQSAAELSPTRSLALDCGGLSPRSDEREHPQGGGRCPPKPPTGPDLEEGRRMVGLDHRDRCLLPGPWRLPLCSGMDRILGASPARPTSHRPAQQLLTEIQEAAGELTVSDPAPHERADYREPP